MKKFTIGLAVFFTILSLGVNGQGILIQLNGTGVDLAGNSHTVNITPTSPELVGGVLEAHFIVTNNTGADQQWRVTRKKVSVPATWVDQICWPPLCYNASGDVYVTPNSTGNPAPTITNGTHTTSTGLEAEMKPRITPDLSAPASATYRYYITTTTGTYVDSVDLNINFTLAVNSIKPSVSLSVSPNPASDDVTISLGNSESGSISIVDVLGNTILNETISNGQRTIDVSNFKNGVYFVLINTPGSKTTNRKLIIRH